MQINRTISQEKVNKERERKTNQILLLNSLNIDTFVNKANDINDIKKILKTLINAVKVLQEGN